MDAYTRKGSSAVGLRDLKRFCAGLVRRFTVRRTNNLFSAAIIMVRITVQFRVDGRGLLIITSQKCVAEL